LKNEDFPTPRSFNALARDESFRISGRTFIAIGLDSFVGEDFVIRSLRRFDTVYQRDKLTDGLKDRQIDGHPTRPDRYIISVRVYLRFCILNF